MQPASMGHMVEDALRLGWDTALRDRRWGREAEL
jgi:hypothetical protein